MPDAVSGAISGGTAGFSMGGPVGAFAGAILGGVLGGVAGAQKSPQEEKAEEILADLEGLESIFKTLPFTKEEVMQQLLPQAQQIYRGAADIVAGKVGAQTGEAGIAQGQGAKEFYLQALAPVIAQGEQLAGGAIGEYASFFAQMSENQKAQLLSYFGTKLNAAQGLPSMTTFQRTVTGAMSGMQIGSNIQGDIAESLGIREQADEIQPTLDKLEQESGQNVQTGAQGKIEESNPFKLQLPSTFGGGN